ncbi:hypothetical protein [Salegentibacter mishustinae]|uniref:hypothetical protein n=1 Tax=Salegentibacter mishustinae TaxID=270918 RepID=UPI002490BCEC|nr:hypothetical protein [Salegentibacter mishustinae]
MSDKFSKLRDNTPNSVQSSVEMKEPNAPLKIYDGVFTLKNDKEELKIAGEIKYNWIPDSGVYFIGNPVDDNRSLFNIFNGKVYLKVLIDDLELGEGFITNIGSNIQGVLSSNAVYGDKSISVDKILFSVPNLREFMGNNIKKQDESNCSFWRGRIELENEKHIIRIDKKNHYKDLKNQLKAKGGYIFMYDGELISKSGPISYKESKDIFYCLNTFLTFINGRRTSAIGFTGVFENEHKWYDYTNYSVDQYKNVESWTPSHSIAGLNEIWQNFSQIWKNEEDRDFLTSAIHWYVEANNNSGYAEGSIIMAQTALELIYNWWIIERKEMILGKDAESINASNKIRLLLSQLNIGYNIPEAFDKLEEFKNNEIQILDGPDAVVQIRNAIVHSQQEKRKKLSSIHYMAKYQALQLCLWYIELSILKILGFNQKYYNRTSSELVRVKSEENLPWIIDKQ